jgi:hypothetical protein
MATPTPSLRFPRPHALPALLLALAALTGCAALPANDIREQLDEASGTTLTRLDAPVELTTTTPRGAIADPFAYVAAFETNRMGKRERWLWIAVPDERGDARLPELSVAGRELTLGSPVTSSSAGLLAAPYPKPAPWSAEHLFRLDAAALAALASGAEWRLRVPRRDAAALEFAGRPEPADLLRRFAERTGADLAPPVAP